jgi:hypothetical protein
MGLLEQPIESAFRPQSTVLVAGAGGGFDLIAGLSVALGLERAGHRVVLANLSFTQLEGVTGGEWVHDVCLRADADCRSSEGYFPEAWLSEWFRDRGREVPVYCLQKAGGVPLADAYRALVERQDIDSLVLVDGGVDAVLRGDEHSLGTPTLDHLSIAAAAQLELRTKVVACIGFGAERHDRISHAQALNRFADLAASGALLGVESLVQSSEITRLWLEALAHIHRRQGPLRQSIVSASIEAAVRGRFGDTSVNARTEQTPIWISPLTALCWYFELDAVAAAKPYLAALQQTRTVKEASEIIEKHHAEHRTDHVPIPI